MTPHEMIKALKAGEIDKVLEGTRFVEPTNCKCSAYHEYECACSGANWYTHEEKDYAAKVEVTKVVLDEAIERVSDAKMLIETAWMDEPPMPCELQAQKELRQTISLMQQLKESL